MDPSLAELCETRGYVLRRELLELGYVDKELARWVRSGGGVRMRRGVYCTADTWRRLDADGRYLARCRAVQAQADSPAALSHVSALAALGINGWEMPREQVHLTRFDQRGGRREAGVVQHRGSLWAHDVTRRQGVWVTSPTRTALDLTTILDVDHSVVAIDALLNAGATTVADLHVRYEHMERWPGTLGTNLVLRLVDARSESVGESLTRLLCWRQGLPAPVLQHEVWAGGRLVARLDLAWPEYGVWLEFDGRGKYERHRRDGEGVADAVLREKRREDTIRRLTGWRCVRISWSDLARPGRVAAVVREAMAPSVA